MRNILITGGAGFIGSNFIKYFLNAHPGANVINLDKLTYAGNLNNLKSVADHPRYRFIKGDVCDKSLVTKILSDFKINGVFHFAAESHVDRSIESPTDFIRNNILGTTNLLECAREVWGTKKNRILNVSTDEVYGSIDDVGAFSERSHLRPSSAYSASKASADLICEAFHKTYNIDIVTTRSSNNFGPHQHKEKLVPSVIHSALRGEKIGLYGDGLNVRDWIYVEDNCTAIDLVFQRGISGERFNIGGNCEYTNERLVKLICSMLDRIVPSGRSPYSDLITYVADRLGHDRRYALSTKKIEADIGWKCSQNFEERLFDTVAWYVAQSTVKV